MESSHDGVVTQRSISNYLLSVSEELKKVVLSEGECHPELIIGRSEILDIDDISNITNNFLGNTQWYPAYSSSLHKRSLNGMYDRLAEVCGEDTPMLILVKDTNKRVFGALISKLIQPSEQIFELEHSIILHCRPKFEISSNVRDHCCRASCQNDSLLISCTGAQGELWLDKNLTMGRILDDDLISINDQTSQPLKPTGRNQSAKPSPGTFKIKTVECWIFGHSDKSNV